MHYSPARRQVAKNLHAKERTMCVSCSQFNLQRKKKKILKRNASYISCKSTSRKFVLKQQASKVRTSPHPFADVTRRRARLMVPPPLPLCVEREPERMAVSDVVRGAFRKRGGKKNPKHVCVIKCGKSKSHITLTARSHIKVLTLIHPRRPRRI